MTTRIKHQSLTETKTVAKPWGQEKWIQTGQGSGTGKHSCLDLYYENLL